LILSFPSLPATFIPPKFGGDCSFFSIDETCPPPPPPRSTPLSPPPGEKSSDVFPHFLRTTRLFSFGAPPLFPGPLKNRFFFPLPRSSWTLFPPFPNPQKSTRHFLFLLKLFFNPFFFPPQRSVRQVPRRSLIQAGKRGRVSFFSPTKARGQPSPFRGNFFDLFHPPGSPDPHYPSFVSVRSKGGIIFLPCMNDLFFFFWTQVLGATFFSRLAS